MKILVIDNYDSFTYNLVQLLGNEVESIIVKRNDEITIKEISELNPDKIKLVIFNDCRVNNYRYTCFLKRYVGIYKKLLNI